MRRRRLPDLSGQRFGRLVVIQRNSTPLAKHVTYECACDCGKKSTAHSSHLANGRTRSCGCLNSELSAERRLRHGDTRIGRHAAEYAIWRKMIERCRNPNDRGFKRYGGRGIGVCERWASSYEHFLADVGRRPSPNHSLDRYPNNDGNYEPGNVRWATLTEQARNTRRNRVVEIDGERRCVAEWSELNGLHPGLIKQRLDRDWSPEAAVSAPPLRNWNHRKGARHG